MSEQKPLPNGDDTQRLPVPDAARTQPIPRETLEKLSEEKVVTEEFTVVDAGTEATDAVKERVVAVLKTVFDPEIPVNIYELGMVYEVRVDADGRTLVEMTLTSPNCPVAGSLPGEVEDKVRQTAGVTAAKVALVWDPPWSPDLMSDAAKLQLNMY
ncbi:MAG: DUF59 domain-containing protein [Planctomycetota bacterium]